MEWGLDDVEFLSRLYDLQALPSRDTRFKDAAGDIWQHRINNDDWDQDWIFADERFNLADGPSEQFLRFLCEVVHPVVRPDRDEAVKLVSHFNEQLRQVAWEIFEGCMGPAMVEMASIVGFSCATPGSQLPRPSHSSISFQKRTENAKAQSRTARSEYAAPAGCAKPKAA